MLRWIAVSYAFFMTSTATSITNEEIEADALVRFHWSESNKIRNNTKYGADVKRRATALDGQLATIMEPPFGPFWLKNPRRIVIQSLDDPDIILAVKQRNLKLEERIKINLFHATNDSWWSVDYLRKQQEFCNAPGIDYALMHQGHGQLSWDSHHFVNEITLLPDPLDTAHKWMTAIKKCIADCLWKKYQDVGSSFSFDDGMKWFDSLIRYDHNFREHLKIHFKSIHQHGGIYQEMRWPPNNRISLQWLFQGMDWVAHTLHERMLLQMVSLNTSPTSPTIFPLIKKMIRDVARREVIEFNETLSTLDERIKLLVRQLPTDSSYPTESSRRFLSTLMAIPQYVSSGVKRFQEVTMLRDMGETFVSFHPSLFQGKTIAIAVPGDIIPNVDRLKNFLYRVIKRLGLKHKCKVEVFEV